MSHKFVSVLVVGAGSTGLTAANLLGMFGIQTQLIERDMRLNDSPRAISIDDEGLRICQALGLRDEVLEQVLLGIGAQFFSQGQLLVRVTPSDLRNGYPRLSTFSQPRLVATLLAGLARFPCVEVLFGHELSTFTQTGQEVLVSLSTPAGQVQKIACAYLLACDGGKSTIRRTLGIPMRGTTFPQRWLVVDGICEDEAGVVGMGSEMPSGYYATCFFDPVRPAVSIPAPDWHWRWEFLLRSGELENPLLTPDSLQQLLLQIGDTRHPHIIRQAIYTFHASHAISFAHGRVFLLGDAAHLLPPFGGQGMNCGLRDASNLVWKLALVLSGQAQHTMLETYQQERQPHVIKMIRFSSFLGHIIMCTGRPRTFFRDVCIRTLMKLPLVASALTEMRIKPETFYKDGLFFANKHERGSCIGCLLPQPTVLLPENQPVLLDELLGSGFALLRLHSDPSVAFQPLQADLWQKLGARYICLVPAMKNIQKHCEHITSAVDSQQQIAHFLRSQRDHFVLVRPDRHVLGLFRVEREQAFATALQERFFA
jgi:3-(3-hydroxy-phenyl)propionate hydroxylase